MSAVFIKEPNPFFSKNNRMARKVFSTVVPQLFKRLEFGICREI